MTWIGAAVAIKLEGDGQIVAANRTTLGLLGQAHDFLSPLLWLDRLSKFNSEYTLKTLVTYQNFLGKRLEFYTQPGEASLTRTGLTLFFWQKLPLF